MSEARRLSVVPIALLNAFGLILSFAVKHGVLGFCLPNIPLLYLSVLILLFICFSFVTKLLQKPVKIKTTKIRPNFYLQLLGTIFRYNFCHLKTAVEFSPLAHSRHFLSDACLALEKTQPRRWTWWR